MDLRFKRLSSHAFVPTKAHPDDAGFDLYLPRPVHVVQGEIEKVGLGLAVEIPRHHVGLLTIRSSLGARGLQLANAPGVIDAGYRGELAILLSFDSPIAGEEIYLSAKERVAQLIVLKIPHFKAVLVEELSESDGRGVGGFGSSGT